MFIEAPKALPSLYRIGSAGRGMNGERAPGVNRQTAGNLARQRLPQEVLFVKYNAVQILTEE